MNATSQRLLFILDLNGTLLHRLTKSHLEAAAARHPQKRSHDCTANGYKVYFRPGHKSFLRRLFRLGDIAVWTSAMPKNAVPMVTGVFDGLLSMDPLTTLTTDICDRPSSNVDPSPASEDRRLLFLWTQDKCEVVRQPCAHKPDFRKDLNKVWSQFPEHSASTTLMIDDSAAKLYGHTSNLISIPEFLVTEPSIDHTRDTTLARLGDYLEHLSRDPSCLDVRDYLRRHPFNGGAAEDLSTKLDVGSLTIHESIRSG